MGVIVFIMCFSSVYLVPVTAAYSQSWHMHSNTNHHLRALSGLNQNTFFSTEKTHKNICRTVCVFYFLMQYYYQQLLIGPQKFLLQQFDMLYLLFCSDTIRDTLSGGGARPDAGRGGTGNMERHCRPQGQFTHYTTTMVTAHQSNR